MQEALHLRQAKVSQHLATMRGAGIVAAKREGVHVFYRVVEPKVRHILECIRDCDWRYPKATGVIPHTGSFPLIEHAPC